MKDISGKYILPKEITSLDDIPNGVQKKALYIVATDADIPYMEQNALCFITSTQQFRVCVDEQNQTIEALNVTFYIKEYLTLNAIDIANKSVRLKTIPMPNSYTVFVVGGTIQMPNVDYSIVNDNIVWNELGLDGQLTVDDTLYIEYLPL